MGQRRYRRGLLVVAVVAGLTMQAQGQGTGQFQQWNRAVMLEPLELKPATACSALLGTTGYDFSVTSATTVPATGDSPEYCRVVGLIQPEVRFHVSLPAVWNGYSATRRAYFDGCSTGGRQGLISAQRFPDDFDGIVVGAPVLDFSGTMINYNVVQRALAVAPLSIEKIQRVAAAAYAQCDKKDGVGDGVIDDPPQCGFDPSTHLPRCTAGGEGLCFTDDEIAALNTIYRPTTRNGVEIFPAWPVGAEVGSVPQGSAGVPASPASAWVPWFVAGPKGRPVQALFGETFMRYMAFGRAYPDYDWMTFDLEKDYEKVLGARVALDATDPNLARFRDRGGKIVSYFGWADPALNPMMGIRYYESVVRTMGTSTADFYRLFMVPGLFHCVGGVGVNSFDVFTPLVQWVERGAAPAMIPAARVVDGKVVRTRPLCPYPQVARYQGSGSTDDAANFACVEPQRAGR